MATKLSANQTKLADNVLARLDKAAADIQANHQQWGMSFEAARAVVNLLDKVADDFEVKVYGPNSLANRQAQIVKTAEVLQSDADEAYMKSFAVDQGIVQSEADEPYMSAYSDDQSSAVRKGVSTSGRPLT